MWYLFESSDGWCVVHVKNVLQAGQDIAIGDTCTYYYQGKKYDGKVLLMDGKFHQCHKPALVNLLLLFLCEAR
jgi:hypothetical protein